MKKYFVLLLLSFVLVSCNKVETQPIITEVSKNTQKEVSNTGNNIIVKNDSISNTGEIIDTWSGKIIEKIEINEKIKNWDYKSYSNNEVWISFKYPIGWGDVTYSYQKWQNYWISEIENLTSIDKTEGINFVIWFTKSNIKFTFYNSNYLWTNYPNSFYKIDNPNSYIDNFQEVSKNHNICVFKYDFSGYTNNDPQPSTYDTLLNDCKDNINSIFYKHSQFFWSEGYLYTYHHKFLSYFKTNFNKFPYLIIEYSTANTPQLELSSLSFDDFNKNYLKKDFNDLKTEFNFLVNSVKVSQPSEIWDQEIEINTKDLNIKRIQEYYLNISKWKLQEALDMRVNKVSLDKFKEWYINTFKAFPYNFEEINNNEYKFHVEFQEHNKNPQKYEVIMEIQGNKLYTKSSKEINQEVIYNKNLKARVEGIEDLTTLILEQNWLKKTIVTLNWNMYLDNSKYKYWIVWDINFSKDGKYLIYYINWWEYYSLNIYQIASWKTIISENYADFYWFTTNNKYLYIQVESEFSWDFYFKVFEIESWKEVVNFYDKILSYYNKNDLVYLKAEYFKDQDILEIYSNTNYDKEKNIGDKKFVFDFKTLKLIKKD